MEMVSVYLLTPVAHLGCFGVYAFIPSLSFYSFTVILLGLQQGVAVNAIYFYVFCEL